VSVRRSVFDGPGGSGDPLAAAIMWCALWKLVIENGSSSSYVVGSSVNSEVKISSLIWRMKQFWFGLV